MELDGAERWCGLVSATGFFAMAAAARSLSAPLLDEADSSARRQERASLGIFFTFCMSCMFSQYVLVSFLSPFFPAVAAKNGLSQTVVGIVLGMDSLASCLFSPVVGFQTEKVGLRKMIFAGLVVSAVASCVVGMVPTVCHSPATMTAAFVVARCATHLRSPLGQPALSVHGSSRILCAAVGALHWHTQSSWASAVRWSRLPRTAVSCM
jgi:MFS family permease